MKQVYKKHPHFIILTTIVIAVIAGSAILSALFLTKDKKSKATTYALYTVKQQADSIFKGRVVATSTTEYREDKTLGELEKIQVSDGQEVKAGDVLLTYNRLSTTDISSAAFAVKNAENELANAQEDVAEASNKDATLRDKFAKTSEDSEKDLINDQISVNNETWKAAERSVVAAYLALEQTQATLTNEKTQQTVTVKAKTAGVVVIGSKSETSPLLSVVSRETIVEGIVTEYDYEKIKVNAGVTVKTVDLKKKVTGKISYLSAVPENIADATTSSKYVFKVSLDQSLQNGYTVQVYLPNEGLYIPKSAVKSGRVYVKRGGKFSKQVIETKEVDGRLLLLSGLKVGDKLVKEAADYVD